MDIQILEGDRFTRKGGKIEILLPGEEKRPIHIIPDDQLIDALIRRKTLRDKALEYEYIFMRNRNDIDYLNYCKSYG